MSIKLWKNLPCARSELQLFATLDGGQSFRWKAHPTIADAWIGVMGNCLWLLRQADTNLQYQVLGELPYPTGTPHIDVRLKLPPPPTATVVTTPTAAKRGHNKYNPTKLLYPIAHYEQLLHTYFRLDQKLADHYATWKAAHPHFRSEARQFFAIRQLDQDPVENLFSFICSQNNHIARISQLVESLCTTYGPKICDHDGRSYHGFPDSERLADPQVDGALRAAKFGYRAKFIQQSAAAIVSRGGLEWFARLRQLGYAEARAELTQLPGIGPKVADCICLMSLGHLGAIPVDTHVYQIAVQHYLPTMRAGSKSVNAKVYAAIGERFREVYGPMAGWAQTVLFCADLAKFREKPATNVNGDVSTVSKKKKC